MYQNPRRLRRPEERVGTVTNADLPPPAFEVEDLLVQRLRAREESAFEQLHNRYHASMVRVARSFVRSADEAEEVIQETWVAVLSGIDRFQRRSSFKTWLFRILINRSRTRARREARSIPFSALAADEPRYAPIDVASNGANPEQSVLDRELRAVVERAVATLPDIQRLVISLRDIEGWSSEEVCQTLKISAGNQRVLLHRARMRARELLLPYLKAEIEAV